jgi:hypothetical protein
MALRAHGRAAREGKDPGGQALAGLAMVGSGVGFLAAMLPLEASGPNHGRAEHAVIGDVRTVVSAQAAYREANQGFYDARLDCLAAPGTCIPAYPRNATPFLDASLASLGAKGGYMRTFVAGVPAGDAAGEGGPELRSRTSVRSFAYVAVPVSPGFEGVRGFCGDSSGALCFTADGQAPGVGRDGRCDLSTCTVLP